MATSNSPYTVVEIRKGGAAIARFPNNTPEPAQNRASEWFHDHTGMSWQHATTYEGYSIVEVWEDNTEHRIA